MANLKIDSNLGGFYLWPPSWIVARPLPPNKDDSFTQCAYKFDFDCAIGMKVSSHGYFLCDFAQIAEGPIDSFEHIDEKVTFRARFLNLILVSLYTAHYRGEHTSVEKHYYSARSMDMNPYHASSSIQQRSIFDQSLQTQNNFLKF